jgi:MFS family permease
MASVLRQHDFRLLWSAQTISELGSAVTQVAFPLIAIGTLHASNFAVGVLTASGTAAWLLVGLPAGVWVDRWPRRPVMVAADLGRAALVASVPLAWALGALTVAQLAVVALLTGVLAVFFNVADTAFLPAVLKPDRLSDGNSLLQASFAGSGIAGPGLGGALVQLFGAPAAVLADAASFVVSGLCVLRIRATERQPAAAERPVAAERRLAREVAEGVRFVLGFSLTRAVVSSVTVTNFLYGGFDAVKFVFLVRQLGVRPAVVGLLFAIGGIGGLAGSLGAGVAGRRFGDARVLWLSLAVEAVSGLMIPLTTRGWGLIWFVAAISAMSFSIALFNVCVITAVQAATPEALLGRTIASTRVFTRSALTLGGLAGGALASVVSPRSALAILMALAVLVPVRLRLSAVGRVRRLSDLSADTRGHTAGT